MSAKLRVDQSEDLNDSWVELHYHASNPIPPMESVTDPQIDQIINPMTSLPTEPQLTHMSFRCEVLETGTGPSLMEKLLMDAQRESRSTSRTTSRPLSKESSVGSSPKIPSSPSPEWSSEAWNAKQDPGTDWIWDWSSRPEVLQSFENWNDRFRHPAGRSVLSVRNSNVMKKTRIFSWENLPTLLLSHATTFFLGAAAVFLCMKKYWNLPAIAHASLD